MVVLCDIDGVLADISHRLLYQKRKNYDKFYAPEELAKDVAWVGSQDGEYAISWEEFKAIANFDYDSGYGIQEIARDLVVVFHAGVTESWIERQKALVRYPVGDSVTIEDMLRIARGASHDNLWVSDSPLWARPQTRYDWENGKPYNGTNPMWGPSHYLQVVGHTPMTKVTQFDNLVSTDVFSTSPNGYKLGKCRFIIVDTEKTTWRYASKVES